MCGGADAAGAWAVRMAGRSPRVRGSLLRAAVAGSQVGSIPAGAGEPRELRISPSMGKVDPRVCGGANSLLLFVLLIPGRSPRVRGSQRAQRHSVQLRRSIPACAGEPSRRSPR